MEELYAHFSEFHMNGSGMDAFFFPKPIATWCKNNFQYYYVQNIGSNVMLSIATKTKRVPVSANTYENVIETMMNTFGLKKTLRIYILHSPFKKEWNTKDDIEPIHINSGFATISPSSNTIVIFRKEESRKVLIHELIHALQLHCVEHGTFDTIIKGHFDEAIVECWATILNCSYLLQKSKNIQESKQNLFEIYIRPSSYDDLFETSMFKKEQEFAIKQAAKLLKAYNCKYANEKCRLKFPALPATYEYYVYKAALLYNPIKFVNQFWWSQLKKCKNIKLELLDFYVNENFTKSLQHATKNISKNDISMKMTLYGDK